MRQFILLILLPTGLWAQGLQNSGGPFNFPTTTERQINSEQRYLLNPGPYPLQVSAVEAFDFYGERPFSSPDTNFTVAAGDSFLFEAQFQPRQNLQHRSTLVLRSEDGFGHLALSVNGQGRFSKSYYGPTENKSEQQLKVALKNLLAQNYNSLSYSVARDNMYATIDNDNGQVECAYTGRTATFSTRSGANSNSFNCEHTFPQGFFNKATPMRSDIHHLFPTDVNANSRRGNDPFGIVNNASWSQGGSKSGGGKFEPRDVQKGATARAMLYFVLRYRDYAGHFSGQEQILKQWHRSYPPDSAERARNQAIFALQNNRNPFVDYPQLERRISKFVSNSTAPQSLDWYGSDDTIRLAQGQGSFQYRFVLVNTGNDSLQFEQWQIQGTALSLADTQAIQLAPGAAHTVLINFDAAQSSSGLLRFREAKTATQGAVPIVAGPNLALEERLGSAIRWPQVSPNPSKGLIRLSHLKGIERLQVVDAVGRSYDLKLAEELDLRNYPAGWYTLVLSHEKGYQQSERILLVP